MFFEKRSIKKAENLIKKYFDQNAYLNDFASKNHIRTESKERLLEALRAAYINKLVISWSLNIEEFLRLCAIAASCFTIAYLPGTQEETIEKIAKLIERYPERKITEINQSALFLLSIHKDFQFMRADDLKWNYRPI